VKRIVMRPLGPPPATSCWHCGGPIVREVGVHAARYIYRGDQPSHAVIEDWMECECGAYQNIRRLNEITVESLGEA
jgi:aerobic-type carbon monoxide dehydrogenase small subunit (CoxS/CutS family)